MTPRAIVIGLLALCCPLAALAVTPGPKARCEEQMRKDLGSERQAKHRSPNALVEIERTFLRCMGLDELGAQFLATVLVEQREAALALSQGDLTPGRARAVVADRQAKLDAFRGNPRYRAEYAVGDRDRDLVPDAQDRCPQTRASSTTDEVGCEYDCDDLAHSRSALVTAMQCRRFVSIDEQEEMARAFAVPIPLNPACAGVPAPTSSSPLGWTPKVLEIQRSSPLDTDEVLGLKLYVVRSSMPSPECELFYEFDVRMEGIAGATTTSMLFSAKEDATPDNADIATFVLRTFRRVTHNAPVGIPVSSSVAVTVLPLSPGRAAAGKGFTDDARITWRVRAINGLGATHGWSEYRAHSAGAELTP